MSTQTNFEAFCRAAISTAAYAKLGEGGWYGTIPGFKGLFGMGETKKDCASDLFDALEGWLLLGIANGDDLPSVGDLTIEVPSKS